MGNGAKFFLNTLGNAPSVGITGATDPVSSETLGAEELEIYGYVGKETAKFKNEHLQETLQTRLWRLKVKQVLLHLLPLMLD